MTATRSNVQLIRRASVGLVLGVLVYAGFAIWDDASGLWGLLSGVDGRVWAIAVGASLANYALRWVKWHYFLRCLGMRVDPSTSIVVFLAGLTMSITPAKAGEVFKSALLLRSDGLPMARTAPIVLAERLTDLLALFAIAALGIAAFDYGRVAYIVGLVAVCAAVVVLSRPEVVGRLIEIVGARSVTVAQKLGEAHDSVRRLLQPRTLGLSTLVSVASWSMEAAAFYWILTSLDATCSLQLAAFIYAMTTILGAISFLPGGLGVTEGSMVAALLMLGAFDEQTSATAATYMIRFVTLWFGVAIGALAWFTFEARSRGEKPLPR